MELPNELKSIIEEEVWNSFSEKQKEFIVQNHSLEITRESLDKEFHYHANYVGKKWILDKSRFDRTEYCRKCKFAYMFDAEPRNYSLSYSADVYNLMRCANVDCKSYFESCF
jgi:hypothetical protein